jgi:pimeloyl-ACP methyl ester carboxylesterase
MPARHIGRFTAPWEVRMTSLLLAALLAAQAALAPAPEPAPDEYVLQAGAEAIGSESVTTQSTAEGERLRGTATVITPAGQVRFTQSLERAAGKVVLYAVDIEQGPSGAVVKAQRTESGWRFEMTPHGTTAPPTIVERPAAAPSILLDNNLASHIDLLTRSLKLAPGAKAAMTAAVPQAMLVLPVEVVRLDDAGGNARYRLTMASVVIEIVARLEDGALLEARVPLQNATYRRRGWEPAKVEAVAREREIVVPSPPGDLPAAIVVPKAQAPVAALLLLAGSGPNDRDETIGPNKPLRDIAVALADRGIATLRFDKRTRTFPGAADPTLAAEYVDDALAALAILRAAPGVDAKRVFVAGHSLGGSVAPLVAARAPAGVRGLILLAPAVRRIDEMLLDQTTFQMRVAGADPAAIQAQRDELASALRRALDPAHADTTPLLGAPPSYWRELGALDLAASLRQSALPFLVVQGAKDVQVRADLDFEVLKAKLGDAGGRASYKLLPGLNHLFMKVEGEPTGGEYAIAGHVAPELADAVAAWVSSVGAGSVSGKGQ